MVDCRPGVAAVKSPIMNAKKENKLSMYLVVQSVLDRNKPTWQTLPAYADGCTEFGQRVANIQTLAQAQAVDTTGLAADKLQLRKVMAAQAVELAGAAHAYAKKGRNNDLAARTEVVVSDFLDGRDTLAADQARNVHAAVTSALSNLAPYGVTAAKLDALKAKIDAYAASLSKPREAVGASSSATKLLDAEFAAADAVLADVLDALTPQFAAANARFVADYKNARIIVDAGGGKRQAAPATPAPPPH